MALTAEGVISLAPDAASATAGRGLANAAKWVDAAQNEVAAWGEAKGSGAKPYQTVVALGDGASKCSCPSRKFPCKHALGLLLRVAAGEVPLAEPPPWAAEWLEKRGQRSAAKPDVPARQADPKSAERRWATVLRGLDECDAFLHDAMGNGLLAMGATRSWDEMAARMVDAQAPGVARRLRRLGEKVGVGSDWGERAAADLGNLGLLVQAARRVDALGELAHDVRAALGIPFRREEAVERVVDVWDVLGARPETEDRLWSCRTWLRGRGTGRWALSLAFAPVGTPTPPRIPSGTAFAAEVAFFPSAWPLRVQLEETEPVPFAPSRGGTWADALEAQADALALNPWIERFPVLLADATLAPGGDRWSILDATGVGFPLSTPDDARWQLLARTGNHPREIFGEFDGVSFFWLADWKAEG